jgi:excisionase family DNA binding protein
VSPRFYLPEDVAEILNVSLAQTRALVRTGELPAIQIGGRNQWRIEATELEAYIQRKYAESRAKTEAARAARVEQEAAVTDHATEALPER